MRTDVAPKTRLKRHRSAPSEGASVLRARAPHRRQCSLRVWGGRVRVDAWLRVRAAVTGRRGEPRTWHSHGRRSMFCVWCPQSATAWAEAMASPRVVASLRAAAQAPRSSRSSRAQRAIHGPERPPDFDAERGSTDCVRSGFRFTPRFPGLSEGGGRRGPALKFGQEGPRRVGAWTDIPFRFRGDRSAVPRSVDSPTPSGPVCGQSNCRIGRCRMAATLQLVSRVWTHPCRRP